MGSEASAGCELQPWERQPGEPERYYAVFEQYLQLGPKRSVRVAVAMLRASNPHTPAIATAKEMCAEWKWRKRAEAWDAAHPARPAPPPALADDRPVWEQQPDEKDRYYRVFRRYLELGPQRNIHRAAMLCMGEDPASPDAVHMYPKAQRWRWAERAEAWDRQQAAVAATSQADDTAGEEARKPWDQQPGEKDHWHRVFRRYLALGPTRNVHRAAVMCAEEDPEAPDVHNAYNEARRRQWKERAEQWDLRAADEDEVLGAELAIVPYSDVMAAVNPWDRQAGEPTRAYGLFCRFLELGPLRSVEGVKRDVSNGNVQHASQALYMLARRWKWRERAATWDAHQRDLLTERMLDLRTAYEERRLAVAEVYFDQAVDAFNTANLTNLTQAEARRMLSTIERILVHMADMQRKELDALEKHYAAQGERVTIEMVERLAQKMERKGLATDEGGVMAFPEK